MLHCFRFAICYYDILLGAVQRIFSPKIRDYYGSGRESPGVTLHFFFLENHAKIALNQYMPVLIFWNSIPYTPVCILSV